MRRLLGIAAALLVLGAQSATAEKIGPSFDCQKAKAPLAQIICADPELSALDLQFVEAYRALLTQVGEQGSAAVKKQDIDFIHTVEKRCGVPTSGSPNDTPQVRACVKSAYEKQRQVWLSKVRGESGDHSTTSASSDLLFAQTCRMGECGRSYIHSKTKMSDSTIAIDVKVEPYKADGGSSLGAPTIMKMKVSCDPTDGYVERQDSIYDTRIKQPNPQPVHATYEADKLWLAICRGEFNPSSVVAGRTGPGPSNAPPTSGNTENIPDNLVGITLGATIAKVKQDIGGQFQLSDERQISLTDKLTLTNERAYTSIPCSSFDPRIISPEFSGLDFSFLHIPKIEISNSPVVGLNNTAILWLTPGKAEPVVWRIKVIYRGAQADWERLLRQKYGKPHHYSPPQWGVSAHGVIMAWGGPYKTCANPRTVTSQFEFEGTVILDDFALLAPALRGYVKMLGERQLQQKKIQKF